MRRVDGVVWSVALGLGLVVAGVACSPADPVEGPTTVATASSESPTPSPTASASPTPSEEEVLIAEATAALEEYVALSVSVLNNAGEGWSELTIWWGNPEIYDRFSGFYSSVYESGDYTVGSSLIDGIITQEVILDPTGSGHERVALKYCSDISGVQQFQQDGSPVEGMGAERYPIEVTFQRQGVGAHWSIVDYVAVADQPC